MARKVIVWLGDVYQHATVKEMTSHSPAQRRALRAQDMQAHLHDAIYHSDGNIHELMVAILRRAGLPEPHAAANTLAWSDEGKHSFTYKILRAMQDMDTSDGRKLTSNMLGPYPLSPPQLAYNEILSAAAGEKISRDLSIEDPALLIETAAVVINTIPFKSAAYQDLFEHAVAQVCHEANCLSAAAHIIRQGQDFTNKADINAFNGVGIHNLREFYERAAPLIEGSIRLRPEGVPELRNEETAPLYAAGAVKGGKFHRDIISHLTEIGAIEVFRGPGTGELNKSVPLMTGVSALVDDLYTVTGMLLSGAANKAALSGNTLKMGDIHTDTGTIPAQLSKSASLSEQAVAAYLAHGFDQGVMNRTHDSPHSLIDHYCAHVLSTLGKENVQKMAETVYAVTWPKDKAPIAGAVDTLAKPEVQHGILTQMEQVIGPEAYEKLQQSLAGFMGEALKKNRGNEPEMEEAAQRLIAYGNEPAQPSHALKIRQQPLPERTH